MKLSLSPTRRRLFLIRHRHRSSLLPFWIYWPQKTVTFALSFVKNTVLGVVKEHFFSILLIVGAVIFGHIPLAQAAVGHIAPDVAKGTGSAIANVVEIVGAVLLVILILLRSYDSTTGRKKKEKVTYSRKIDEDE